MRMRTHNKANISKDMSPSSEGTNSKIFPLIFICFVPYLQKFNKFPKCDLCIFIVTIAAHRKLFTPFSFTFLLYQNDLEWANI